MALGDYTPNSSFWSTIKRTIGTQLLTSEILYELGILRLADRTAWLRDEFTRWTAQYARTSAGTNAIVTGSVDLSTLTYDPTAGTLNGLTLQVQSDSSGLVTVTFGSGGSAPTGPASVVTAINTANGGDPFAYVDAANHLNVISLSTGGSATITIQGGTAVTLLGFTVAQTATGAASGADGSNLIGVAQVVGSKLTIPAGTLRSALLYIANNITSLSPSVSETRFIDDSPLYDDSKWTFGGTGDLTDTAAAAGSIAYWPLLVPHGQALTSVSVYISPPGGHGALPASMPVMTVYKRTISTNAETALATKTDASGSVIAYETVHALTPTAFSEVIDRTTKKYYVKFVSEHGANAGAGLSIVGISYTVTRSTIGSD